MLNIGIVLPNLSANQLAFITINQCNVGSALTKDSFFVFTKNPSEACVPPLFSCMNISEIANFKGILVATDLESAEMILKLGTQAQLVFYIWDLEFVRNKKNFVKNVSIYRNERLHLFTRSNDYADVIENYANRRPKVIENFALLKLRQEITGEEYEFYRELREANTDLV